MSVKVSDAPTPRADAIAARAPRNMVALPPPAVHRSALRCRAIAGAASGTSTIPTAAVGCPACPHCWGRIRDALALTAAVHAGGLRNDRLALHGVEVRSSLPVSAVAARCLALPRTTHGVPGGGRKGARFLGAKPPVQNGFERGGSRESSAGNRRFRHDVRPSGRNLCRSRRDQPICFKMLKSKNYPRSIGSKDACV